MTPFYFITINTQFYFAWEFQIAKDFSVDLFPSKSR